MKKFLLPLAFVLSCAASMSHAATFDVNDFATEYDNLDSTSSRTATSITLVGGAEATAYIAGVTSFDYVFSTTETMKTDEDIAGLFIGSVEIPLSTSYLVGPDGTTGVRTYTFATPTSGNFDFFVADEVALKNPSELQISNIQTVPVSPVPEPESYALLAAGLGAMLMMVKRRRAGGRGDASRRKGILRGAAGTARFS